MSPIRIVALLALVAAAAPAEERTGPDSKSPKVKIGTKVGERLPHFKANVQDMSGEKAKSAAFDSHKLESATAFVFMSKTCPWCKVYEGRLSEMAKTYGKKGVRFVAVYPTRKTSEADKVAYHKKAKLQAAWFLNDKDASIAKTLKVKKTPEIVLVNKSGKIEFRGGIDDSPRNAAGVKKPFLKNACDDVVAGRKVKVTTAPTYG